MVYIIIYNSSFPEDGELNLIKGIFDDKIEAFNKAIEIANYRKCIYVNYYIKEVEEDTLKNAVKNNYTCHDNFIMQNKKAIYHINDPSLVDRNNEILRKREKLDIMIKEINKIYEKIYESEMKLYREKKIRHPIQRKLENISLYNFPYEEEKLKNVENIMFAMENDIIKRKNDLSTMFY